MPAIRTIFVVAALLLVAPFYAAWGGGVVAGPAFVLRVVDRAGQPMPGVHVIADNGLTCRTNANGETWWSEASVRRKGVRFELQRQDIERTTATVDVAGGALETVIVNGSK